MNIFVLDHSIDKSVEYYFDKHIVKMVTESAQLLSSAVRLSGIDAGYKLTHKNHPCAIWTRESLSNWHWLQELTRAMNDEYRYRYDKSVDHKAYTIAASLPEPNIEDIGLTPFRLAMPDQYKCDDAVQSYRNYYCGEKQHIAQWRKRDIPYWWHEL